MKRFWIQSLIFHLKNYMTELYLYFSYLMENISLNLVYYVASVKILI